VRASVSPRAVRQRGRRDGQGGTRRRFQAPLTPRFTPCRPHRVPIVRSGHFRHGCASQIGAAAVAVKASSTCRAVAGLHPSEKVRVGRDVRHIMPLDGRVAARRRPRQAHGASRCPAATGGSTCTRHAHPQEPCPPTRRLRRPNISNAAGSAAHGDGQSSISLSRPSGLGGARGCRRRRRPRRSPP